MPTDLIQFGEAQAHYNTARTRILKYSLEMYHEGLKEHKIISASEIEILKNKAELQVSKWIKKWEAIFTKQESQKEIEANLEEAEERSRIAQEALHKVENILKHTLSIDDTIDWDILKRNEDFKEPKPSKPEKEKYFDIPAEPDKSSSSFSPTFSLFEKLIKTKKEKKIQAFEVKYEKAIKEWQEQKIEIEQKNFEIDEQHKKKLEDWENNVRKWEEKKAIFYEKQATYNKKIENLKAQYLKQDTAAVTEYCEMVLNNSEHPETFPKNFVLEYNSETKILIVEYDLPSIVNIPTVKEVKYVASKKELKEINISDSQLNQLYDSVIYQITLRTLHELFEADAVNAIQAVSFNGWVNSINKATGKSENRCILSIQAKKEEFMDIELENVDPKVCFKKLKGVASSKLNTLIPIQPILQISKTDKRFIESYEVANSMLEATNIAAMDWEDFEHLIREIFEKEFSVNDGEVKVTQASRDGGVDAIAFDPDPIRGGKIVIQAKRYTNTVGVSAVRDLYGTVMNEGATKGILVTTANYGPDAYEFAKGKPLTLLSGSNLLHLLEKHGHHVKIDLKEAKKVLADKV